MKITVIDSTGGTGLAVVKLGIKRGHFVTAFARRPEKLNGIRGIASIVNGNALNFDDVRRAVKGQDAIISVLGTAEATRSTISAMNEEKVKRGVWVSAYPVAATRPWLMVKFSWLLFGRQYRDLAIVEQMLSKSDLDWTVVRPPRLTNAKGTGQVRIEKADNVSSGPYSIARADLATILLDEAESTKDIRAAIVVTAQGKASKIRK
jgi:putative NADH-flavin reductase